MRELRSPRPALPPRCIAAAPGGRRGGALAASGIHRCTGAFEITDLPAKLAGLARVTVARGDFHKPAPAFSFAVNQDVVVYLAVDDRGGLALPKGWRKTGMKMSWRGSYTDLVYSQPFPAGRVEVPPHDVAHKPDAYGSSRADVRTS